MFIIAVLYAFKEFTFSASKSNLAKSILKAMANNKGLVLAGIGGGVAYQVGKSKGRRDQGEILQSKMLPARYRNIQY